MAFDFAGSIQTKRIGQKDARQTCCQQEQADQILEMEVTNKHTVTLLVVTI